MDKLKEAFLSVPAKRFYWTTLASFLGLLLVSLEGINDWWAILLIPIIAGATKEINKRFL